VQPKNYFYVITDEIITHPRRTEYCHTSDLHAAKKWNSRFGEDVGAITISITS
jgi:hypothetical protein